MTPSQNLSLPDQQKVVVQLKLLKDFIDHFGNPRRGVTDRGKAFTSRYFKQFAEESQFKHVLNAIASPRSNGQVERVNRTLLNGLNTMSDSECTWDQNLSNVVWGINNTVNGTTGFSPFRLMFGHNNSRLYPNNETNDLNARENDLTTRRATAKLRIDKNMTLMKERFDRKHKNCRKYSLGLLVLWKAGTYTEGRIVGIYPPPPKSD